MKPSEKNRRMKSKSFLDNWKESDSILRNKLEDILERLSNDYDIKWDILFRYHTDNTAVGNPKTSATIMFEKTAWINHYGLRMKFELSLIYYDTVNEETEYKLQINFGDDCVYPHVVYTVSGEWNDLKNIEKFIEKHRKKVIKMVTK